MQPDSFVSEVNAGQRFRFGENWSRFLSMLNEERIGEAEKSVLDLLEEQTLAGKSFLDIGSGSGLFSLVARRLGARVCSFDYDPQSVACTAELRERYFPGDANWQVMKGSALDEEFIKSLGQYDIVYSWGVLHHTGDLWMALENAHVPVKSNGKLAISIYNDQGLTSRYWTAVKKLYCRLPAFARSLVVIPTLIQIWGPIVFDDLWHRRPPWYSWRKCSEGRGMTAWHGLIDWVGGYPFQVASPEAIFYFYRDKKFVLRRLKTCGAGKGCNEFLFLRNAI